MKIANTASTAVATAVSWVAKMSDMGEGYALCAGGRRRSGYPAANRQGLDLTARS